MNRMIKRPTISIRRAVVVALCGIWSVPALAASLAPTKASQVVVLASSGTTGTPCSGFAMKFDTQVSADGTTSSFSIPAGRVLVIDHLTWWVNNSAASALTGVSLQLGGTFVWSDEVVTDPQGNAG